MIAMKTVYTCLSSLLSSIDPLGAKTFPAPHIEITVEIPAWITRTIDSDALTCVLKIHASNDRLIAGVAAVLARRAAAALARRDAAALEKLIDDMDHVKGWSCYHFEDDPWNDRCDDPDDYVRECLILTHLETETTFYIYLDGAGDLLYGKGV